MAEMVLPPEDAPVCVRDFVRLCDGFGDDEIYRVSSISEEPGLRRVVQLEHGMATLADDMLPALTYAENVQTILKRILSYQTRIRWRVGDIEADEGLVISAIGQTQSIYAALTSLLDMLPPNLCWAFDQTKLPWKLHLRKLPEEISCEGRLTRNISTVRVTRDASRLCTRVFPYGCGQGLDRVTLTPLLGREYIDAADTKTWGIAARTFTSDQIMDADTLKRVAERYLERHSQPTATVQLQGIDLSRITGESLDTFRLGQRFRLALPEENTVLVERIVAMHIPDVFGQPGRVTLTLANRQPALSDEIADLLREVNASKLIGGKLTELTFRNRATGTYTAPISHPFTLDEYPSVLSCVMRMTADNGVYIQTILVDGTEIPYSVWGKTQSLDALPYLRRTSTGAVDDAHKPRRLRDLRHHAEGHREDGDVTREFLPCPFRAIQLVASAYCFRVFIHRLRTVSHCSLSLEVIFCSIFRSSSATLKPASASPTHPPARTTRAASTVPACSSARSAVRAHPSTTAATPFSASTSPVRARLHPPPTSAPAWRCSSGSP